MTQAPVRNPPERPYPDLEQTDLKTGLTEAEPAKRLEIYGPNAIATLKQTLAQKAKVLRNGKWRTIDARDVVPADGVLGRLGNITPADIELVERGYLSIDQSALTGDSLPACKIPVKAFAYACSLSRYDQFFLIHSAISGQPFFRD